MYAASSERRDNTTAFEYFKNFEDSARRGGCGKFALIALDKGGPRFRDLMVHTNWPDSVLDAELAHFANVARLFSEDLANRILPFEWSFTAGQGDADTDLQVHVADTIVDSRLLDGHFIPVHGPVERLNVAVLGEVERSLSGDEIGGLHRAALEFFDAHYRMQASSEGGSGAALNDREKKCLTWLAQGKTIGEISDRLWMSEHLVSAYVNNACKKLNAKTHAHAVTQAIKLKLIVV